VSAKQRANWARFAKAARSGVWKRKKKLTVIGNSRGSEAGFTQAELARLHAQGDPNIGRDERGYYID
jgi:hypothetical protein